MPRSRWHSIGNLSDSLTTLGELTFISEALHASKAHYRIVTVKERPFMYFGDIHLPKNKTAAERQCSNGVTVLHLFSNITYTAVQVDEVIASYVNGSAHKFIHFVTCGDGYIVALLTQLAEDLDFKFQLYTLQDGVLGADEGDGKWDGVMGEVVRGTAHIAATVLTVTSERQQVVDFTEAFYQTSHAILKYTHENPNMLGATFAPFQPSVWLIFIAMAQITGVMMSIFEWNSPYGLNPSGRKRKQNYTMASALNTVWAILSARNIHIKAPKSWPVKVLQNFWGAACITIVASYTGNLTVFVTGKSKGDTSLRVTVSI